MQEMHNHVPGSADNQLVSMTTKTIPGSLIIIVSQRAGTNQGHWLFLYNIKLLFIIYIFILLVV